MRTRRTCKMCKRRRLCGESGYCQYCEYSAVFLALERFLSDEQKVKAFCKDIIEHGKAMRKAMQALQGSNNAE